MSSSLNLRDSYPVPAARLKSCPDTNPERTYSAPPVLSTCGQRWFGGASEDFLGGPHSGAVLHRPSGRSGQHMFERREDADVIQIIVVADVGDAEKFAFHLTLAVGHHSIERFAELFYDLAG